MPADTCDITDLLRAWREGQSGALDELIEVLYPRLKQVARGAMRGERQGHTLQPTALVNELYLRLAKAGRIEEEDRNHLFSIAARMMRQILVDYARKRNALKRGGDFDRKGSVDLDNLPGLSWARFLDLDLALKSLENFDERKYKVLELRYFAGLTYREIARTLGCSTATVRRDWEFGRTWLYREMKPSH